MAISDFGSPMDSIGVRKSDLAMIGHGHDGRGTAGAGQPWNELPGSFVPIKCILSACDFFEFGRKPGLRTKGLSAVKTPENQKSHKLSG